MWLAELSLKLGVADRLSSNFCKSQSHGSHVKIRVQALTSQGDNKMTSNARLFFLDAITTAKKNQVSDGFCSIYL